MPGAYRKLVAFPRNLHWKWRETGEEHVTSNELATNKSGERLLNEVTTCELTSREENAAGRLEYSAGDTGGCKRGEISEEESPATQASAGKRQKTAPGITTEVAHNATSASCRNSPGLSEMNFCSYQKHRDVEVSFTLEPSCYATVCLRELMKR